MSVVKILENSQSETYFLFSEDIRNELKQEEESESNGTSTALPLPRNYSNNVNSEKYYLPFELACQCSVPRVVVIALDCLQVKRFEKFSPG